MLSIDDLIQIFHKILGWFSVAEHAAGMKREYGEEERTRAKSVTAPATVSGE